MSKETIKVITYAQMRIVIDHMIASGQRDEFEPFKMNGEYVESVEDGRTGEIIAKGTVDVEVDVPPLRL